MIHLYDLVFKKLFLSVSVAFFVFNFDEVLSEFCDTLENVDLYVYPKLQKGKRTLAQHFHKFPKSQKPFMFKNE